MKNTPKLCLPEVAAVHVVLRKKFQAAGIGAIRDAEEALGFYPGWIRYHRHFNRLDMGVCFAILRQLKIPSGDFFGDVLTELGYEPGGTPEPEAAPEPKPAPKPEPPEPETEPEPETDPDAPPDIASSTARAVLRRLGAVFPEDEDQEPPS